MEKESKNSIFERMCKEMPWELNAHIKPYIIEAMEIYSQSLKSELDEAIKLTLSSDHKQQFDRIAQLEKEKKSLEQIVKSQTSYQSAYDQAKEQLQSYKELNKALIFYHEHSSCIFCNGTKILQTKDPCTICTQLEQLLK